MACSFRRQSEEEGRTFSEGRLGPDVTTVALNNLSADGQPHTAPLVFLAGMKPSEDLKDLV
jgi:hypothetical protein